MYIRCEAHRGFSYDVIDLSKMSNKHMAYLYLNGIIFTKAQKASSTILKYLDRRAC